MANSSENPSTCQSPGHPWIIGHRGASEMAPENTRPALEAAIAWGCDGVEIDVQMTRDNIPILFHDRTLHKITGRRTRVSDVDFQQLRNLDWGNWFSAEFRDEPILPLAEVLQSFASRTRLLVEIKSRNAERRSGQVLRLTDIVVDMVRTLVPQDIHGNLFFLSFDRDVLAHAHRREPEWAYVWNGDGGGWKHLPDFAMAGCIPIKKLTARQVRDVHRDGKLLMTYSCNTPQQADHAMETGADVLMTDRPDWLIDYLRNQGIRRDTDSGRPDHV